MRVTLEFSIKIDETEFCWRKILFTVIPQFQQLRTKILKKKKQISRPIQNIFCLLTYTKRVNFSNKSAKFTKTGKNHRAPTVIAAGRRKLAAFVQEFLTGHFIKFLINFIFLSQKGKIVLFSRDDGIDTSHRQIIIFRPKIANQDFYTNAAEPANLLTKNQQCLKT